MMLRMSVVVAIAYRCRIGMEHTVSLGTLELRVMHPVTLLLSYALRCVRIVSVADLGTGDNRSVRTCVRTIEIHSM